MQIIFNDQSRCGRAESSPAEGDMRVGTENSGKPGALTHVVGQCHTALLTGFYLQVLLHSFDPMCHHRQVASGRDYQTMA